MIRRFDFNTMTFSNMRGNDVIRSIEMSPEGNFVKYDDHLAEIAALRVKLGKAELDTGVDDKNGLRIKSGDTVNVTWTAELGITELDCEYSGVVGYMPDGITAGFMVVFDPPYFRHVCEDGHYEVQHKQLFQVPESEDWTISFEVKSEVLSKGKTE